MASMGPHFVDHRRSRSTHLAHNLSNKPTKEDDGDVEVLRDMPCGPINS